LGALDDGVADALGSLLNALADLARADLLGAGLHLLGGGLHFRVVRPEGWRGQDEEEHTGEHQWHRAPPVRLSGVAARAHAATIRLPVTLVVPLVLVEAVEGAAAGAEHAADRRALARALAAVVDGAGRAEKCDRRSPVELPSFIMS